MSGVEFVAVLGIAASAIQVVESCTKIIKRIQQYRQAVVFEDIIAQLELFSRDVDYLSSPAGHQVLNPLTETAVLKALDGCRRHLGRLDEIIHSLIPAPNSTKLKRALYGIRSARKDKEIRDIIGVLSTYQLTIQFHLLRCNMQATTQILDRIDSSKEKIPAATSTESKALTDNSTSSLILGDHDTTAARRQPYKYKHNQKRSSKCARGICTCNCHISKKSSSGSWMAISLLQTVFCGCEDREYVIALHLFRTICILHLSLHWQEGVVIKCGLDYYGTVNYTSPGFMILHLCREGLMDLQQARNELRVLREKGEINFKEVDPSGDGWIEKLLRAPWLFSRRRIQYGLLYTLFTESSTISTDRILLTSLKWVGEGPHLYLLESLLGLGLDPSDAGFKLFHSWPEACSPDWQCPDLTPDPFFIEAISMLVHGDPEFGGTTRLQKAVLMSDYEEVKMLLDRDRASALLERNFRGQTALHLAIRNPKMLRCLIESSGTNSVDTEDHDGTTPFMYAAAYNEGESAILLLNSGAELNKFDKLNSLSFIGYAMFRNNYDIIQTLIDHFRRVGSVLLAQSVLDACLWSYICNDLFRMVDIEMKGLRYLVSEGGNVNVVSERGNTLLHFSQNSHDAALLLSRTGNPINQQNSRGYTPLIILSRFGDPMLIRKAISEGATVNTLDNNAMSALRHLINNVRLGTWNSGTMNNWTDKITSIAVLLLSGANILQGDSCLCACSISGCTATSYLFHACECVGIAARTVHCIGIVARTVHCIRDSEESYDSTDS